jgi:hypothetical protein
VLALYLVTLIVGGGLVLLSAVAGGDDHEGEIEHEHEHEHGEGDGEGHETWIPFLSLRFWTWFAGFFGLTGLLLTSLSPLGEPVVGLAAGGTGFAVGLGVSAALRWLRRGEGGGTARLDALVGREGRVLVTVRPGLTGKIRCHVGEEFVDVLADLEADHDAPVAPGEAVLVLRVDVRTPTKRDKE